MKIVFISETLFPARTAHSVLVAKMCQALVQEGHSVYLIAPRRSSRRVLEWDFFQHYGIEERFPIRWIPLPVTFVGWYYIYGLLAALLGIFTFPDLVYAPQISIYLVISSFLGIPTICELHQLPGGTFGGKLLRLLIRMKGFKGLVCNSSALKQMILEINADILSDEDILVANNGIALEDYRELPSPQDARKQLGLQNERFTIGYVGHLYQGRGINLIIKIAARLPMFDFFIVGGNDDEVNYWRDLLTRENIDNIIFWGFVPHAEVPQMLAACDVLVMPYQQRVEVSGGGDTADYMNPMKMLEYMASGRFILASDLPALRELLNEQNSELIDPTQVSSWCAAIEKVSKDTAWKDAKEMQALLDVQDYSWKKRVKRVLKKFLSD